ncbi:isochorismatase family protein [Microvirga massiliensis]|uniref:isochorismatase family protein n=1 Tax=Microvirga massiliensis TaxID=1033741 RepID=UPI00062B6A7C|nr:isochorismatase family protein [Microvirga massiliensis]
MMYEEVRELYLSRGFGGRVGFGMNPAVIVIDMARSWLDESSPLGSRNAAGVIEPILTVLAAARGSAVPVFFTTMTFDPAGAEAAGPVGRKLRHSSDQRALDRNSGMPDLDPRLGRRADEILIEKQRASAFWGTPFGAYLTARRIDTLIITGCSTSGCVRATAESAHNAGLHTIIAKEAVADRSSLAHECNLIDIDMRYGDVVPTKDVVEYLYSRMNTRSVA